jgi:hypothetical protein
LVFEHKRQKFDMATIYFKSGFISIALLLAVHSLVRSQELLNAAGTIKTDYNSYPTPPRTPSMLFYLQRSLDLNSVIYQANYEGDNANSRKLDDQDPVNIYWLINDGANSTRPLSQVQKLGYGLKVEDADEDWVQLHLVAYKKMPIRVKYAPKEGRYNAYVQLDGKDVILKRVFINIDGGTKLRPNVTFIELSGIAAQTGHRIVHRFKP